jgi:ribosomal protein L11 methyltransferase
VQEEGEVLVTHFPEPFDDEGFARRLREVGGSIGVEMSPAPDVDWSERWRDGVTAHDVGALSIAPPWLARDEESARTVVIDPGMAFGTGEHPSTRGVVRLVSAIVGGGEVVADLGAGSAVLSIAAAKLGAARVVAVELDPDAIANAEENVARNGVADRVTVIEGDAETILPLVAPVDVVVANILSSVIVRLLPAIGAALAGSPRPSGGIAVIGGMLVAERTDIVDVLRAEGWTVVADDVEGEWWSATIRTV